MAHNAIVLLTWCFVKGWTLISEAFSNLHDSMNKLTFYISKNPHFLTKSVRIRVLQISCFSGKKLLLSDYKKM